MRHVLLAVMAMVLAAPLALAQATGYRIQPGDTLTLTVLEDETLNRQLLVTPDGRVSVPLAGTVQAAGQTVEQIESTITARLAENFAVEPNVFVSVVEITELLDTYNIYVLGRVGEPGLKEVEVGTTLLQAIALAGGFDRFAATSRIQLRRTDPQTGEERLFLFNYNAVEKGSPIQSMIALREGDVLIVPERRLFE